MTFGIFSSSWPDAAVLLPRTFYWGRSESRGKWSSQQDLISFISSDEHSEKLGETLSNAKSLCFLSVYWSTRNKTPSRFHIVFGGIEQL